MPEHDLRASEFTMTWWLTFIVAVAMAVALGMAMYTYFVGQLIESQQDDAACVARYGEEDC